MATNTNFFTSRPVRRTLIIATAVAALSACGSDSQTILSDQQPVAESAELTTIEAAETVETPNAVAVNVESPVATTESPNTTAAEPITTAAEPITTQASVAETAAPATTATPAPEVLSPESVGAGELAIPGLMVVTEPGDPLNVRVGPGVEHAIVGELAHRTEGVDVSHSVEIDFTTHWHLVSVGGEELGWVHSGFLYSPSETANCVADAGALAGFAAFKDVDFGDVDGDGLEDAVQAFQSTTDANDFVIRVDYGNGGSSLSDSIAGAFFHPAATGLAGLANVTFLPTYLPSDPAGDEILFGLGSGSTTASYTVLTQQGCDIVQTTVGGQPASFTRGASVSYSSTFGCGFDAHGETTLEIYEEVFNDGADASFDWTLRSGQLEGTQWLLSPGTTGTFLAGEDAVFSTDPTTCGFDL